MRKMRKVFLRSPVLTVLLGRRLALLARPALKIIASGGDVGMAALGPEVWIWLRELEHR